MASLQQSLSPDKLAISLTRRLWRLAYWFPRDLALWTRLGFPQRLIYFGGRGYGDTLLLNTVAHELYRRGIRTAVLTDHPDLLRDSPVVCGTLGLRFWRALEAVARFGGSAHHLPYYLNNHPPTYDEPADSHIILEMCRHAGVTGRVDLRTYFDLKPFERNRGSLRPRQAVVQALSPASENISLLKIYHAERLAAVVEATAGELDWVQIGSAEDPPLSNTLDLRSRTSVRESAAILAHSRVFLGSIGFLMHLARAVECRSVIIFGGRESPRHSGYTCNENFVATVPCAPCYRRSDCLASLACMKQIGADAITTAVRRAASLYGEKLAVDTAEVPAHPVPFPLPWLAASAAS